MKTVLSWIGNAFGTARAFVAQYIGEIVCGAIAVRQLIIWDWFGAIISGVVAVVIFVVNRLKA